MTKGQEIIEELGFKLPELDCEEGATIIIGHNAKSKEELKQMI